MNTEFTGASLIDTTEVPHEGRKTSVNTNPNRRLIVRVTVRPTVLSQMLLDGRLYGPGEHMIQIYKEDLGRLNDLLEPDEDLVKAAYKRYERELQRFLDEKPGVHTPLQFEQSPSSIFQYMEHRGIRPLTRLEVLEEIGSIQEEARFNEAKKNAQMIKEIQGGGSSDAHSSAELLKLIASMADTISKLNTKMDAQSAANKKGA